MDTPGDFHPAVAHWFARALGEPTPPQRLGWPHVRARENTLILAPTGSGKTLAAFLVCIDELIRAEYRPALKLSDPHVVGPRRGRKQPKVPGPSILYVSPLKALNYDIERNLRVPLRGIRQAAFELDISLPDIEVAVRTGDTTQTERQRMLRNPPDILITTPESLHLMLTSQARQILRHVQYCIVDEIHSVCDGKRGVFLSLLLERLQQGCEREFVRIGLSATMQPLSAVAGYLGGQSVGEDGGLSPRPVAVVDAGQRRELDVRVICPAANRRAMDAEVGRTASVWPAIFEELLELIRAHRSTIVFVNSRQHAERIARELNERAGESIAYPHHGSVAPEIRREIEDQLKRGNVPAVVATGTLELGIDMGDVDLVCQVGSPKTVSRGLQRVGRAGHLMSKVSKGRILPTHPMDLVESAVVGQRMLKGDVERVHIPRNCLDVLAQQLVAMVAADPAPVDALFNVVRGSYCYRDLRRAQFDGVVEMISGRYACDEWIDLRPRVSYDPVRGVLEALPGAQNVALTNGGTIPETGQFRVCIAGSTVSIGEVDEEFVHESRPGDRFILGTSAWRITKVDSDRVTVVPASIEGARMPFWLGETVGRPPVVGLGVCELIEQVARRATAGELEDDIVRWLMAVSPLDVTAAEALRATVEDQHDAGGLPTPHRVLMEQFRDSTGDYRLALVTLRGARFHNTLRIALHAYLSRLLGVDINSTHSDDGILMHIPDLGQRLPFDLLAGIEPDKVYDLILDELAASALFGMRFRENAARALLLPGNKPGHRTPLWLQRLKAKDLLQIVKDHDAFPIIVETYRECLEDYLDVEGCREFLQHVRDGEIEVHASWRDAPSPLAATMAWRFQNEYLYVRDDPPPLRRLAAQAGERRQLAELLEGTELRRDLDQRALDEVEGRLQGTAHGWQARTAAELYELVRRLGDLTQAELRERVADPDGGMCEQLLADGRIARVTIPGAATDPERLVDAARADLYRRGLTEADENTLRCLVRQHLATRAFVTPAQLAQRYGAPESTFDSPLQRALAEGEAIIYSGQDGAETDRYSRPDHLDDAYRATLALSRREARPVSVAQYACFLAEFQHVAPDHTLAGPESVQTVLDQLTALPVPAGLWESVILPGRITDYRPEWLDELLTGGVLTWRGAPGVSPAEGKLAFTFADEYETLAPPFATPAEGELCARVREALAARGPSFAHELSRATSAPEPEVLQALWDMLWAGEVTQDDFRAIRRGRPPGETGGAPDMQGHTRTGTRRRPRTPGVPLGRWVLLPAVGESAGDPLGDLGRLESLAWVLLRRYGVICRAIAALEDLPATWGELYATYQRLELQGLIVRGYFVEELEGAQFALPEVPDRLRRATAPGPLLLNVCDPACLYGTSGIQPLRDAAGAEVPVARHPANWVITQAGVPEVAIELAAGRITLLSKGALGHALSLLSPFAALCALPAVERPFKRAQFAHLGNEPILGSALEPTLRALGFQSDGLSLVYAGPIGEESSRPTDDWRLPRRPGHGTRPKGLRSGRGGRRQR